MTPPFFGASTPSDSSPTSGTVNARAWIAGGQTTGRGRGHRDHDHPVGGVQRDPQAAARRAGHRRRRPAGPGQEFITALPTAGATTGRTARLPFPDEVAQALAAEANLAELAATYDLNDNGPVTSGRPPSPPAAGSARSSRSGGTASAATAGSRCSGTTRPRSATMMPRSGSPNVSTMFLAERQRKTLDRFTARYGYRPTGAQRAAARVVPHASTAATTGRCSLTHQWFYSRFRPWVDAMDLGHFVPHQARHTLATNLLRHGATLTHIRRYLGQVSDRMAEHYVHLSHSDLENVLQHVWVSGPGTASPGELLAGTAAPLSQAQAQALAVDLSRRSTPAEGGFCTFQPVVDGGACPWNLNCHSCDRFVLSGADLLYWRRKREQWRLLAEGAPDDATASYLHDYFEPTARAIDGLEKALAGLGLLDHALALDLRKPQDYFQRVWNTAFLASDLAKAGSSQDDDTLTSRARRPRRDKRMSKNITNGRDQRTDRSRSRSSSPRAQAAHAACSPRSHPDAQRKDPGHRRRHRPSCDVSRTFLYTNPEARPRRLCRIHQRPPASSGPHSTRHRARSNLARTRPQRRRRPKSRPHRDPHPAHPHRRLLGQIRDLEAEWTKETIQRITTENTTLKQRVRQLTTDNRTLNERLKQPGRTCGSKTAASPTLKPSSQTPPPPPDLAMHAMPRPPSVPGHRYSSQPHVPSAFQQTPRSPSNM